MEVATIMTLLLLLMNRVHGLDNLPSAMRLVTHHLNPLGFILHISVCPESKVKGLLPKATWLREEE